MGDGGVVEQDFSARVAASRESQFSFRGLEEHIAALRASQLQRHIEQRQENLVENAGGIQLARGFEEDGQLLEIGDLVGYLNAGNLAEEVTRRVRSDVLRMENRVDGIASTKLEAVIALQRFPLHPFAVHKRSVLAALVLNEKLTVLGDNQRVVARDPRIGDGQVLLHLAANRKRRMVEVKR